jgi:hypothetical protein
VRRRAVAALAKLAAVACWTAVPLLLSAGPAEAACGGLTYAERQQAPRPDDIAEFMEDLSDPEGCRSSAPWVGAAGLGGAAGLCWAGLALYNYWAGGRPSAMVIPPAPQPQGAGASPPMPPPAPPPAPPAAAEPPPEPGGRPGQGIRPVDVRAAAQDRSGFREMAVDGVRGMSDAIRGSGSSAGPFPAGGNRSPTAQDPANGGGPPAGNGPGRGNGGEEGRPNLVRQDDDFRAEQNHKGQRKSHLNADGDLVPANPAGEATIVDHIVGRGPIKSDSPFTSLSREGAAAKDFGRGHIRVDLRRLEQDIAAGSVQGVEVHSPDEVRAAIQASADSIAGRHIDLSVSPHASRSEIDQLARSHGLNDEATRTIRQRIIDMKNTTRDEEWLIRGTVPHEYIEGPFRE